MVKGQEKDGGLLSMNGGTAISILDVRWTFMVMVERRTVVFRLIVED